MNIKTTYLNYSKTWQAIDVDTYDGPGCLIGTGQFKEEAIQDLLDQMSDASWKAGPGTQGSFSEVTPVIDGWTGKPNGWMRGMTFWPERDEGE